MSRDHRKLRVYHAAHALTLSIYKETKNFPRDEWFGIRRHLREAAVSITANLVEGNARRSTAEYVNFLNVSRGSAAELAYLIRLSSELGYLSPCAAAGLSQACDEVIPQFEALIQRIEQLMQRERVGRRITGDERPKTKD